MLSDFSYRLSMGSQRAHVMVLTPCYGGMVTSVYAVSMVKLTTAAAARSINIEWKMSLSDAMIPRARAELVALFLENTSATHFLFIDADIGFEPDQAFRLIEFDVDVAAAAYPAKYLDWPKISRVAAEGRPNIESAALSYIAAWNEEVVGRNGFARVRFVGTGFMLVRREVVTKLCDAHPELKYRHCHVVGGDKRVNSEHRYALFDPLIDPQTGEYLSEDFAFCRRWTDLGGEIWIDTNSRLDHYGPVTFKGDLATQFRST